MSDTSAPLSLHDHRKATRKMRWWYESLADFMVTNPGATQGDMAMNFGKAESTISTIVNSDAFKAYLRQRRAVHVEKLDGEVREKLFKAANRSLDHMLDVLEKKRDTIPLEMLQRVADSSLKNLGYGVTPPGGTTVNVNTQPPNVHVAVSLDDLELARAALRRNQQTTVIDVSPASSAGAEPDKVPIQTLKDLP